MPTWSPYQERIFREVSGGVDNLVVIARAGSGKTTTIVEAMQHVPRGASILYCCFGREDRKHLASVVPPGTQARTLNSVGYEAVRAAWGRSVKTDRDAGLDILGASLAVAYEDILQDGGRIDASGRLAKSDLSAARRLLSLAKNCLCSMPDEIAELADEHDVSGGNLECDELASVVSASLVASREPRPTINFDDQLWLPVVNGLPLPRYDFVFVDEVQDLNACQVELVKALCEGRMVAVGDDRQAIYDFRGASSTAVVDLMDGTDALCLPLPISYRCARRIVAEAQSIVPDIEAAPEAPEGDVQSCGIDRLYAEAAPGDFVLSRTNAKAAEVCLGLITRGRRAMMVGRDIGGSIRPLLEMCRAQTVRAMLDRLDEWKSKSIKRAVGRAVRLGRSSKSALRSIEDRAETLRAVANGAASMEDVERRIGWLSDGTEDRGGGPDEATSIACSTVHKAKGKEADRVWALHSTFWEGTGTVEEDNIWYVAVTRARTSLRIVEDPSEPHPARRTSSGPRVADPDDEENDGPDIGRRSVN